MRRVPASVLLLSLFVAAPVAAESQAPAEGPTANAGEEVIQYYYRDFSAKNYANALSDAAMLSPEPSNRTGQAVVNAMRAAALLGLNRDSEAKPLIASLDELSPTEPIARQMLFEGALQTDHFDVAADSIDSLIDRAPDAARNLDWNFLRYFFRNEPKDQDKRNDDRRIALVRIGYGADGPIGRSLATDAVKILCRRGDVQGARSPEGGERPGGF